MTAHCCFTLLLHWCGIRNEPETRVCHPSLAETPVRFGGRCGDDNVPSGEAPRVQSPASRAQLPCTLHAATSRRGGTRRATAVRGLDPVYCSPAGYTIYAPASCAMTAACGRRCNLSVTPRQRNASHSRRESPPGLAASQPSASHQAHTSPPQDLRNWSDSREMRETHEALVVLGFSESERKDLYKSGCNGSRTVQ